MVSYSTWLTALAVGYFIFLQATSQMPTSGFAPVEIAQLITQGGLGAAMLYVWKKTFDQASENQKELRNQVADAIGEAVDEATEQTRQAAKRSADRHDRRENQFLDQMKDHQNLVQKVTGVMMRMEAKLKKVQSDMGTLHRRFDNLYTEQDETDQPSPAD